MLERSVGAITVRRDVVLTWLIVSLQRILILLQGDMAFHVFVHDQLHSRKLPTAQLQLESFHCGFELVNSHSFLVWSITNSKKSFRCQAFLAELLFKLSESQFLRRYSCRKSFLFVQFSFLKLDLLIEPTHHLYTSDRRLDLGYFFNNINHFVEIGTLWLLAALLARSFWHLNSLF